MIVVIKYFVRWPIPRTRNGSIIGTALEKDGSGDPKGLFCWKTAGLLPNNSHTTFVHAFIGTGVDDQNVIISRIWQGLSALSTIPIPAIAFLGIDELSPTIVDRDLIIGIVFNTVDAPVVIIAIIIGCKGIGDKPFTGADRLTI